MSEQVAHHRNYVKIWAILLVLLVISVAGPFLGNLYVTLITAFGIAGVKAYLVAKNFMHLDIEKPIIHWLLFISLAFMVLLFSGVAPDVMKDKGQQWEKGAGFHYESTTGGHGDGHGDDHGQSDSHGAAAGHGAEPGAAEAHGDTTEGHGEGDPGSEGDHE